jgi:hypothetical protein
MASTSKDWTTLDNKPGADEENQQLEERRKKFQKHLTDVILSENLIVLTGLGTSLSVKGPDGKPLAPTMSDLWSAAKQKAEAKFEAVKTAVSYTPDAEKENIEHLLSRCQMSERLRPDPDVASFISDTEGIIVSKCRFVDEGLSLKTHEAFLRKIGRRSTRLPRLKLFTTNYDLCFEAAASRTRFIVIDGFSHSMPQEFDGGYFGYDLVKRREDREVPDYITNVFHLYKLHGSVDWCLVGSQVHKAAKPEKPLIIYPRESKFELSYDQPFLELMSRLQMALRQANTGLLVIGFGFNDRHIAQPVLAAMKSNIGLKALVVSPMLEKAGNPIIDEMALLVREGDPRLALLETVFENLVPEIPDLVAATEEEQHMERLRNLGGAR